MDYICCSVKRKKELFSEEKSFLLCFPHSELQRHGGMVRRHESHISIYYNCFSGGAINLFG